MPITTCAQHHCALPPEGKVLAIDRNSQECLIWTGAVLRTWVYGCPACTVTRDELSEHEADQVHDMIVNEVRTSAVRALTRRFMSGESARAWINEAFESFADVLVEETMREWSDADKTVS